MPSSQQLSYFQTFYDYIERFPTSLSTISILSAILSFFLFLFSSPTAKKQYENVIVLLSLLYWTMDFFIFCFSQYGSSFPFHFDNSFHFSNSNKFEYFYVFVRISRILLIFLVPNSLT